MIDASSGSKTDFGLHVDCQHGFQGQEWEVEGSSKAVRCALPRRRLLRIVRASVQGVSLPY